MYFKKCSQESFGSINVVMLTQALYYCQNLLNCHVDKLNPYLTEEIFKKNCFVPEYKISQSA